MARTQDIPMSQIASGMVIRFRVTGIRRWRVRFAIATWLFRLGAWVGGVGFVVDTAQGPGD